MPSRPPGEQARRVFRLFVLLLVLACAAPAHAQKPYAQQKLNEALALLQEKQDLQAITPLEEAIKAEPGWSAPRIVLAKVRFGLTQYPQAIQQMETVLGKPLVFDPKEAPNYWTLLGKYRYIDQMGKPEASRKFDDSVKAFEKAVGYDKKAHEADYYLARISLNKGDLSKASDYIKAALDGRPGDPAYRTLQADILYRQGRAEEASTEVNEVLVKMQGQEESKEFRDAKDLAGKVNADLSGKRWKKIGLVGGPVLLLVILGLVGVSMMRNKRTRSVMLDANDIGGDANSHEEICATALRRLSALTQMAHGVMYITTLDGDEMLPKATLALEPDEVKPVMVDLNEIPRWVERNDGKPFLFKAEKKEGTFIKAFPDAREQMEPLQIRIGVPFIFQERMLGMAFIGVEESKDMLRLKKLYDRSQGDIYRIAVEYAASLYRLYEDDLAYVDVLTKFKSRRYVEENLPRALVDAEDAGRKGAVVMFEFDQFRALQEQYGDTQAETVLKTVAGEIKLAIPPEDGMVARFEGGKFFAFAAVSSAEEAYKFAERIHQRVCDTRISRNFAPPTGSVGLAVFPDHGKKADDLIWAADRVMMGINAGGGNAIGTSDGTAPDRGTRSEAPSASAPTSSSPSSSPESEAPRGGFVPGRPADGAAAPKPFMGGTKPPPLPPAPGTPPPLPTAPAAPGAGATKTGFVPGFSGGPATPVPGSSGLLRGSGSAAPTPPPPPAMPAKAGGIPGFAGGGPTPGMAPAAPPPVPGKPGGIPGFAGGGSPPPLPTAPPPLPQAPSTTPPVGGPPRSGVPGMTPRPPAPPPGAPPAPPVPGFSGAPKASSTGLTKKVGAKSDTGGLTPKASNFPGAAKSGVPARSEGKPLFPATPPRPTLPAAPEHAEAPEAEPPPPATKPVFPGAPVARPPAFPGAPSADAKPAFPGAPARPPLPGPPAGGAGKIPGFGGGSKPPVDLDAPTVRNPVAGDARPAATAGIPGFGGRPKSPVDLDAPTVRGPVMGDVDAPRPAAPAAPRGPIDGPTVPWAKPAGPADAAPAVPWGAPATPPPIKEEAPSPHMAEAGEMPAKPGAPSTPPWLQAELEEGGAGPMDSPAASTPAPSGRSGLLGGKSPAAKPPSGGKLFRRSGEESGEASAPPPPTAAAAPSPYPINATDRDATGFVGNEVLTAALQREIERAEATHEPCSVLYFQLDRQGEIASDVGTDRLASIQGEIASLVNDFLKEGTDIPGRWHDGFVIVLPRTSSRIACNLAEQIRFTVSNLSFPGLRSNSTLSIGIAGTEHARETQALLQSAREAAGQAEGDGGNAIKVYGA